MDNNKTSKLRVNIIDIRKAFANDFHKTAEESRNAALKNLRPGEVAPRGDKIIGEKYREAFENRAREYRSRAYSLIDGATKSISVEMGEAPSADAVNALTALSLRSSLTQDEVDAALATYGSNYSFHQALRDIAAKSKLHIDPHPLADQLQEVRSMASWANDMTIEEAEKGRAASPGLISFLEWSGDGTI